MNSLGILVPIIALMIPIVAIVMKNWRAVQNRRMDLVERGGAELNAAAQARIERLEERVAVLERIATDSGNRLSREIEKLRH